MLPLWAVAEEERSVLWHQAVVLVGLVEAVVEAIQIVESVHRLPALAELAQPVKLE